MIKAHSSRPALRSDAIRNQAIIVDAAREVFAVKGLSVALEEVAATAGVGIATLYRRFPDRESLIVAVFEQRIISTIKTVVAALDRQHASGWDVIKTALMSLFEIIAEDKGIRELFLSSRHPMSATDSARGELIGLLETVIARAQDEGKLRSDISVHDIPPLMLMVGIVADFSFKTNPQLWRRYCGLLIDGLSCGSKPSSLAPRALTAEEMALAMSRW